MHFLPPALRDIPLILVLGSVLGPAGAVDALPPHPFGDDADAVFMADQEQLLAGLLASKPGSIWNDPRVAAQRAHIIEQFRLLGEMEGDDGPGVFFANLDAFRRHYVVSQQVAEPQSNRRDPIIAYALDAGAATPAIKEWWQGVMGEHAQPGTRAGVQGFLIDEDEGFTVWQGQVMAICAPAELAERLLPLTGELPVPTTGAVAQSQVRLAKIVALLAVIAAQEPEFAQLMDGIFPDGWSDLAPLADLQTRVDAAGGWHSRLLVEGLPVLPFSALSTDLAGRLPPGEVTLAGVIDMPEAITSVVRGYAAFMQAMMGAEQTPELSAARAQLDAQLTAMAGVDLAAIQEGFSGELATVLSWPTPSPIPSGVLVLGLRQAAAAKTIAERLLPLLAAQPLELAGAEAAWTVNLPFVPTPFTLALSADALVVGTAQDLVQAAMAGTGQEAPWQAGDAGYVGLDLPALGARWLPRVHAELSQVSETIGRDPLMSFRMMGWHLNDSLGGDTPPASLSALLLKEDEEEGGSRWIREGLENLYGAADLATALDTKVAVLSKPHEHAEGWVESAIVVRVADGWKVVRDHGWRQYATAAEVTAELTAEGYQPKLGPALADLGVTETPVVPTFDARWLPEVAVVLEHLPARYELRLRQDTAGLSAEESGVPVLAVLGHALAIASGPISMELGREAAQAIEQSQRGRVEREHEVVIAALQTVGGALSALSNNGEALPAKASELVVQGKLRLEDLAGLFGGVVPTSAAALDKVGRWNSTPEGWPEAVWAVHLEDGWAAYVSPWGQVEVTTELQDVPPTPPDAAQTQGDKDAMF